MNANIEESELKENTGVFTADEVQTLNENDAIRKRLIDNFLKDGNLPTKVGELRILNELMGSRDGVVKLKSDARLKKTENNNKGQIIDIVEHILKGINNRELPTVGEVQYVLETVDEAEFVAGELEIQPEQLSLEDFKLKDPE